MVLIANQAFCQADERLSFMPETNKDYLISAWVSEDYTEQPVTFTVPRITIISGDNTTTNMTADFYPVGYIIDGWQKIEGKFTIPENDTWLSIQLKTVEGKVSYYDDIRIQPLDSNLKSFVYDIESRKLVAELDENNYASFYEYDKEGGLIRVKKETEKGIFTIQETRSSTKKNGED